MSAAQFLKEINVNLNNPLEETYIGKISEGDIKGNKIIVNLFRGTDKVTPTGSVTCIVTQSNGNYFSFTGGISSGSIISEFTQAVYSVGGPISVSIRLTTGNIHTVVAIIKAYVVNNTTSSGIDPESIQPTDQEVLDLYNEMLELSEDLNEFSNKFVRYDTDQSANFYEQTTARQNILAASQASVAALFDDAVDYTAGKYITYMGTVHKFTQDHPAGAWNPAHAANAVLGDELQNIMQNLDIATVQETMSYLNS